MPAARITAFSFVDYFHTCPWGWGEGVSMPHHPDDVAAPPLCRRNKNRCCCYEGGTSLRSQPKLLLSGKRESGALPAQEHKTCAVGVKFGGAWVAQDCAGRRRGGAGRRRGRAGSVHGAASHCRNYFLIKGGRGRGRLCLPPFFCKYPPLFSKSFFKK